MKTMLKVLLGLLALTCAAKADSQFLEIQLSTSGGVGINEGALAQSVTMSGTNIYTGSATAGHYVKLSGEQLDYSTNFLGEFSLAADRFANFSLGATLAELEEGPIAPVGVKMKVNNREILSYRLDTDQFFYGSREMVFERTPGFTVTPVFGGRFEYIDSTSFLMVSASGVEVLTTIQTVPEPESMLLLGLGAPLLVMALRRRCGTGGRMSPEQR